MDRRGNPRRPNNQEPEDEGLGFFLGIAAVAGAAIAAGAYLFSQSSEESSRSRSTTTTTSPPGMPRRTTHSSYSSDYSRTVYSTPSRPQQPESSTSNAVVLAVDATPTRGGGILRMSNGDNKILYFYSVNWSNYFKFPQEPDKFEMINALLALRSLKRQIQNLKQLSWDDFLIKVDNNFIFTSKYPDPENDAVLQRFKAKLSALNGTSEKVSQRDDHDMENANQLSKGGATEWVRSKIQDNYPGYRMTDVSDQVMSYLDRKLSMVPRKYYNDNLKRTNFE